MWQTFSGGSNAASPLLGPGSAGPGQVSGVGGWHPTVLYMVVLVAAEIVLVGWLSRTALR